MSHRSTSSAVAPRCASPGRPTTPAGAAARRGGAQVSGLVVHSLWPVPETAITRAMAGVRRVVVPELNLGLYRRETERLAGGREGVGGNRIRGETNAPG